MRCIMTSISCKFFSSRHLISKNECTVCRKQKTFSQPTCTHLHFNHTNAQMETLEHKMQDQLPLLSSSFFNLTAFISDSFLSVVYFTDNRFPSLPSRAWIKRSLSLLSQLHEAHVFVSPSFRFDVMVEIIFIMIERNPLPVSLSRCSFLNHRTRICYFP